MNTKELYAATSDTFSLFPFVSGICIGPDGLYIFLVKEDEETRQKIIQTIQSIDENAKVFIKIRDNVYVRLPKKKPAYL